MNAAVVQNPDGTSGVIVEEGCSAQNTSVAQAAQAAAFGKPRADPFKEQDQVAMAELMKMNDQFAEALDTHGTPDKVIL